MIFNDSDTIVAPATPTGGALCIIRVSGEDAIAVCDKVFRGRKPLSEATTATVMYGDVVDGDEVVDDVLVSIFRAPRSYTGEDSVEISSHGSRYIVERILSLIIGRGARMAEAGEFTRRAFLNGRMDLSQAEAVADIIASDSHASHAIATTQMRGAYSEELQHLRSKLLNITSLLELELDFSEEDVEFANRAQLVELLQHTLAKVELLANSFSLGNALKEGITVAIAGRPNVGKSTLLNRLAGEERAMVSDIAGTTRDTIEVTTNIGGVIYRFVDTAGLHATSDRLEQMGIERTTQALNKARIILWLTDDTTSLFEQDLVGYMPREEQMVVRILTKIDLRGGVAMQEYSEPHTIALSAKTGEGLDKLMQVLGTAADADSAYRGDVIVSNRRHYHALRNAAEALTSALEALQSNIPTDLLSEDIRLAIHHLGSITGEINSEDILKNIFSHFCIGK